MDNERLLNPPVIADPVLTDEVDAWENEGGTTLHIGDGFEPESEGDDAEEG